MNDRELLRLDGLCRYFGHGKEELRAVDNVSFTVERGEVFGLVGESGCGKTTTGRTVIGLYPPTKGRIYFDGELIADAERESEEATGLWLNIALNYGGRDEIKNAVKKIVSEGIAAEDITEDTISERLYTAGQPDPDYIIRPSGEFRLSNYLIWQSAYAEYWFSDVLWPDFKPHHLEKAIEEYNRRNRRFGGV